MSNLSTPMEAMESFSNGTFQKFDWEMLKKRMEWFSHSPQLGNEVLPGQNPSLDSSASLDLESGVLPGQNPILDLKSGKEHPWWVDYLRKDFEDRFHQRDGGEILKVEYYNRREETAKVISFLALYGGVEVEFSYRCHGIHCDGSECRDAEGERSRSGTSQDLDGGGVGSLSGESQGPDREGSALGENQGGDGNSEGNGSGDGGDEHQGGLDVENGVQENNQEEIDIPRNEINMAIIGATTVAAVDFHYNGFISTTILGLLTAINVFAFLCCMTSMLHSHRNPRAARIFGTIGAAAGSFGFLLLVSVPFSSYYPWMILILGSLAILVIFVLAFKS